MQREKYKAVWLRMLAEGEIRLARDSYRLFKAQGSRAANAYEASSSIPAVVEAITSGRRDWQKVLIAHYALTIKGMAEFTNEQLTGTKAQKQNFQMRIQNFINSQGLKKSGLITDTTIEIAKKIITDGQADGVGEQAIGKALQDAIGGAVSDHRARTIARTETHGAATYAMQETAKEVQIQTGANMTREWVAVEDSRTREAHAEADTQVVGMDEPFDVGGELLDRPGDPSGSPENTINCRCVVAYHFIDASGNESDSTDDGENDIGPGGFIGE